MLSFGSLKKSCKNLLTNQEKGVILITVKRSKRKGQSKMKKVTKEQLKEYSKIYEMFYDNGYDCWLIDLGEILIKQDPGTLNAFVEARQDAPISDRELATYAAWYMKYHNDELLKTHRQAA